MKFFDLQDDLIYFHFTGFELLLCVVLHLANTGENLEWLNVQQEEELSCIYLAFFKKSVPYVVDTV